MKQPLMNSNSRLDTPAKALHKHVSDSPADLQFLRAVYLDLAGRTPLPEEREGHTGMTRAEVIRSLAGSQPFFQHFYEEQLFYFLLIDNFRPSTDRFLVMSEDLVEGRLNVKEAIRAIVSSQFFNARNPGNDTFVTVVLEQLLGITVQKNVRTLEAGKKMYDGKSLKFLGQEGGNQADLVRIVVEDERFESFLVGRLFLEIFRAEMPSRTLARDAERLRESPASFADILSGWLGSEEYEDGLTKARSKNNRQFVRSLYVDLLGRQAEYQEYRRCRNALLALSDSGPLRSVLIKLMLDSGQVTMPDWNAQDPAASVRALFQKFLCRQPDQTELPAFVAEASRVGPQTLLRALLTHPEYHSY